MKKVGKLLLYIILSICVIYTAISTLNSYGTIRMTIDFVKHGDEEDILAYSKMEEENFRNALKKDEEASKTENENTQNTSTEDNKEDVKDEDKKDKDDKTTVTEEKTEENDEEEKITMNEIAKDYPMGFTEHSMLMARGDAEIQVICWSVIYGIIIGVIIFMFSLKNPTTLKQLIIMYIITILTAIVTMELIQVLTLVIAYGVFTFVKFDLGFLLLITAFFGLALAIKKVANQKPLEELDKKSQNDKKTKKENKKKK